MLFIGNGFSLSGVNVDCRYRIIGHGRHYPIGIFARYVLNNALSWPEPVAILCMVTFTFIGAAVSYRAGSHIAVSMVIDRLGDASRRYCSDNR